MGAEQGEGARAREGEYAANVAMRATTMIAAAMVAATELIRMSRCLTWASSWAMTPSSSRSSRIWRIPWVTATAACDGLRPVAKALADGFGMMETRGAG